MQQLTQLITARQRRRWLLKYGGWPALGHSPFFACAAAAVLPNSLAHRRLPAQAVAHRMKVVGVCALLARVTAGSRAPAQLGTHDRVYVPVGRACEPWVHCCGLTDLHHPPARESWGCEGSAAGRSAGSGQQHARTHTQQVPFCTCACSLLAARGSWTARPRQSPHPSPLAAPAEPPLPGSRRRPPAPQAFPGSRRPAPGGTARWRPGGEGGTGTRPAGAQGRLSGSSRRGGHGLCLAGRHPPSLRLASAGHRPGWRWPRPAAARRGGSQGMRTPQRRGRPPAPWSAPQPRTAGSSQPHHATARLRGFGCLCADRRRCSTQACGHAGSRRFAGATASRRRPPMCASSLERRSRQPYPLTVMRCSSRNVKPACAGSLHKTALDRAGGGSAMRLHAMMVN